MLPFCAYLTVNVRYIKVLNVLFGSNGVSGSQLTLSYDEDIIRDSERSHTTELLRLLPPDTQSDCPHNNRYQDAAPNL